MLTFLNTVCAALFTALLTAAITAISPRSPLSRLPGSEAALLPPPEPVNAPNDDYSTVGGCSNVWNGAGLGTVHSRPVAPSHGLSLAFS